jgi:hypothetical protein
MRNDAPVAGSHICGAESGDVEPQIWQEAEGGEEKYDE